MKMMGQPALIGRRLVLTGASALALSGCFGSFGASRALWGWNDGMHPSKWVKWLVFFGLCLIPVYELFLLADALVINSVEFWTGSNPVKNAADGRTITRVATADPNTLRLEVRRAGRLEYVVFCQHRSDGTLALLDASGRPLSVVQEQADGSVEVRGGDHLLLARLDGAATERALSSVQQGQPAHVVLDRELGGRALELGRLRGGAVMLPELL
jgi:hypothetical protein